MSLAATPLGPSYASILVPVDLSDESDARIALAADLADRFQAQLIGTAAHPVEQASIFERTLAIDLSAYADPEVHVGNLLDATEVRFRKAAGARNDIEWRQAKMFPEVMLCEHARSADLVVVTQRPREERLGYMLVDARDLVLQLGRPILLVPTGATYLSARRVMIAWKDAREARRAVWDSLPFLRRADEVTVVGIGDETSADSLMAVERYLSRHDVVSRSIHRPEIEVSITDDLVQIALAQGADLIICGAYGHSRLREWVLGSVTGDLMNGSGIACFMSH